MEESVESNLIILGQLSHTYTVNVKLALTVVIEIEHKKLNFTTHPDFSTFCLNFHL